MRCSVILGLKNSKISQDEEAFEAVVDKQGGRGRGELRAPPPTVSKDVQTVAVMQNAQSRQRWRDHTLSLSTNVRYLHVTRVSLSLNSAYSELVFMFEKPVWWLWHSHSIRPGNAFPVCRAAVMSLFDSLPRFPALLSTTRTRCSSAHLGCKELCVLF